MALNTDVAVPSGAWTQLTANDVTAITVQNKNVSPVFIKGTVGAVPPTDATGAIVLEALKGVQNTLLSDLWPGIAATRVYAFSPVGTAAVMVSHA